MDTSRCLSRLQKLCSKAEYCTSDIRRKARYVDDARYASAYAREKATIQGWGPVKIRFQLRGKGIADAVISEALAEIEPAKAEDKLERVLAAKARTLQGDPQFRLKLLKFGLTRGYNYDEVEAAVSKIIATFAAAK